VLEFIGFRRLIHRTDCSCVPLAARLEDEIARLAKLAADYGAEVDFERTFTGER
jgi:hypothetical protein